MSNLSTLYNTKVNNDALPLLSVVMPVYNPDKYLAPCLDSVLNQTFRNFELIAIDDCSTDGAANMLMDYAARDSRLIVLKNKENMGAARTRNRGLNLARGKYIAFLDADDYFEKDYFADALQTLENNNGDVVISPISFCNMQSGKEHTECIDNIFKKKLKQNVAFNAENFDGIFQIASVVPFNKIADREFILSHGIRFQDLKSSNDVFYGLTLLAKANRILYLNKSYVHYRTKWFGQITANRGIDYLMCSGETYIAVKNELQKCGRWNI